MKLQTNNHTMAISQKRKGTRDVLFGAFNTIVSAPLLMGARGGSSIVLVQNIGKDPPGRLRNRGKDEYLIPDSQSNAL